MEGKRSRQASHWAAMPRPTTPARLRRTCCVTVVRSGRASEGGTGAWPGALQCGGGQPTSGRRRPDCRRSRTASSLW